MVWLEVSYGVKRTFFFLKRQEGRKQAETLMEGVPLRGEAGAEGEVSPGVQLEYQGRGTGRSECPGGWGETALRESGLPYSSLRTEKMWKVLCAVGAVAPSQQSSALKQVGLYKLKVLFSFLFRHHGQI